MRLWPSKKQQSTTSQVDSSGVGQVSSSSKVVDNIGTKAFQDGSCINADHEESLADRLKRKTLPLRTTHRARAQMDALNPPPLKLEDRIGPDGEPLPPRRSDGVYGISGIGIGTGAK